MGYGLRDHTELDMTERLSLSYICIYVLYDI